MAQYTKSQLVSASNATYFTNTSGGISASAVRDLNDSWISSSALLSGSNTFIGNQIISGTMTAQLPANYIWLGDSNGYNQAVATSSISLQGAQGIQGLQGTIGSQGVQGITGAQGITGSQGITGAQGIQGIQGIQGADNSTQGAQGTQGIQGIQGADNSTQGAQGTQGTIGAQGIQGITGITGSNGTQGAQGIQGVQGTQGDNVSSGSLLVTASFASTNITFTKGDATTFDLPGFATTGSNTFTGNQTISTTGNTQLNIVSSTGQANLDFQAGGANFRAYGLFQINNNGQYGGSGSIQILTKDNNMELAADQGIRMGVTNGVGNGIDSSGFVTINVPSGSQQFQLTGSLNVSNTLTASLANGFTYVGNASGRTVLVATSSFGTSINTGSFATTGSNTFYGDQTISGSVLPLNNFGGNLGSSGQNWTNLYVNEIQGLSNLRVDTIKFNGVTLPLASSQPRQLFGNGIDADTAMYYATSSANVNALRELAYVQSGSATTPDMNILSASFASTIGSIVTGTGFLTTGSLAFGGSTNKGNGLYQFNVATGGAGYAIEIFNTGSDALYGGTGSMRFGITDPGNPFIQLKGQPWFQFGTGNQLQFQSFTSSYDNGIIIGPYYTASAKVHLMPRSSSLQFSQDIGSGEVPIFTLGTKDFSNPSQSIFETDLRVKGQFTASLQQGYAWVGNASGISTLVATSSFGGGGSTDTGSFLTTASFNTTTRDITFTKGDASTFNLGGFAITGSNTFIASQTINASNALTISSSAGFGYGITLQGQQGISLQGSGGPRIQFPNNTWLNGNENDDFQFTGDTNDSKTRGMSFFLYGTGSRNMSFRNDSGVSAQINFQTTGSGSPFTNLSLQQNQSTFARVLRLADWNNQANISMVNVSGSLSLTPSSFNATTASLLHLSASNNNQLINLVFKNNNNTGTTIISGSNNIFTNPATPTTGYIRYIGGANNLYLNSSNGVTSQITASAISVSGVRPVMNNNIFQGTADFVINQAVNGGTHTYSNNLFGAANAVNINALAYTGSSFTVSDNIFKGGLITINPASASLAEIAAGVSGSANVEVSRNISLGTGVITINVGPQSKTGFNSILGNTLSSTLTVTNISSSANVAASANIGNAAMTYSNAGAAGLALHRSQGLMNSNYGGMNLIASASSITALGNTSPASMAVTNRAYSGSLGSGSMAYQSNAVFGLSNTYTASGSYAGTATGPGFVTNGVFGSFNTFFTNVEGRGNYVGFSNNIVGGGNLIITGSNNTVLAEGGGGYFGRWNANDGIRNTSGENIFLVGTGVSGSRKTGFLIDSGSNIYAEGTFNVSGSTSMTGSLVVSSFTTLASVSSSLDFADDTAAAAGGVPLGGLYRNGNFVMIRLT